MKRTRIAAAVASAATLALALTACGGSQDGAEGGSDGGTDGGAATGDIRVWLVGTDTPDTARDYLKSTFEKENTGSTLTIEEQSWTGLVDKYTTVLASDSDAPDLVEIGNTQAAAFTSAGAFQDLTDSYEALGGDDLLPGFVESGSYDGKFYAAPYYSGARVVVYSKDITKDTPVPTTWDQYLQNIKDLTTDKVSGLWTPGKDWRNGMVFVWANGGQIATLEGDQWKGGFSSPEAVKGLEQLQDVMQNYNHTPADSDETDPQVPFCAGEVAYLAAPSWVRWSIAAEEDAEAPGCVSTIGAEDKLSAFAIPGQTEGEYAPVLAGGSNIAIPTKAPNPELAHKALEIMLSDGYQKLLAENGLVPAKVSQAKFMGDDAFSQASAAAAAAAQLTPASPLWADVEASGVLEDSFVKLAQGEDVTKVAADLDAAIESTLNG